MIKQVEMADLDAFWRTGRARGVLQVSQVVRSDGRGRPIRVAVMVNCTGKQIEGDPVISFLSDNGCAGEF